LMHSFETRGGLTREGYAPSGASDWDRWAAVWLDPQLLSGPPGRALQFRPGALDDADYQSISGSFGSWRLASRRACSSPDGAFGVCRTGASRTVLVACSDGKKVRRRRSGTLFATTRALAGFPSPRSSSRMGGCTERPRRTLDRGGERCFGCGGSERHHGDTATACPGCRRRTHSAGPPGRGGGSDLRPRDPVGFMDALDPANPLAESGRRGFRSERAFCEVLADGRQDGCFPSSGLAVGSDACCTVRPHPVMSYGGVLPPDARPPAPVSKRTSLLPTSARRHDRDTPQRSRLPSVPTECSMAVQIWRPGNVGVLFAYEPIRLPATRGPHVRLALIR
jgi:hypothetical protein